MTDAAQSQQPAGPQQQPLDPATFWPKYMEKVQTLEKQVNGAKDRADAGLEPSLKDDILPLLVDAVELLGMQQLAAVEYIIVPGTIQQMVPPLLEQILPDMVQDIVDDLGGDRLTVVSAGLLREVILALVERSGIMEDPTRDDALAAKVRKALELVDDAEEDEESEEALEEGEGEEGVLDVLKEAGEDAGEEAA